MQASKRLKNPLPERKQSSGMKKKSHSRKMSHLLVPAGREQQRQQGSL
jgi:hypothetical protein